LDNAKLYPVEDDFIRRKREMAPPMERDNDNKKS
jgi:hypothetical protein